MSTETKVLEDFFSAINRFDMQAIVKVFMRLPAPIAGFPTCRSTSEKCA